VKVSDALKLIQSNVGQSSSVEIEVINYKTAVIKLVKQLLTNIENYLLLREQLWKPDVASASHWNDISKVINEKHDHCGDELSKLASFSDKL
jgi:hypothetical protein